MFTPEDRAVRVAARRSSPSVEPCRECGEQDVPADADFCSPACAAMHARPTRWTPVAAALAADAVELTFTATECRWCSDTLPPRTGRRGRPRVVHGECKDAYDRYRDRIARRHDRATAFGVSARTPSRPTRFRASEVVLDDVIEVPPEWWGLPGQFVDAEIALMREERRERRERRRDEADDERQARY